MSYIIGAFFLAYLMGSIPFGLILTKFFLKKDIRNEGSGNIGATNVLRAGNKKLAAATLFLDAFKAIFPIILIAGHYSYNKASLTPQTPMQIEFLAMFVGLGAIIGHCYPIWLNKGGKGVATTIGALIAAVPYVGMIACLTWLTAAYTFKFSSLAALIAVAIAPITTLLIYGAAPAAVCLIITALVFFRHKENIKRLLNGEEPKIGSKKQNTEDTSEPVSK